MNDLNEKIVELIANLTADRVIIQALAKYIAAAGAVAGEEQRNTLSAVMTVLTTEQARFGEATSETPAEYAAAARRGYQEQFAEIRELIQSILDAPQDATGGR
jgi:Spy/CpxP family protein refolding chaperone